ncbi:uncharacterized protein [Rutidosis leptorrhynchoides]|uniref:uncharacterized protein n=1 Tax=Rutidosis leptorrhynchoides TaxID=125765 RepID=UPI003A9A30D1
MGEILKTQDKLKAWELRSNLSLECSFCKNGMDSHSHLFFECLFTARVWDRIQGNVRFSFASNRWCGVLNNIINASNHKSASMVVAKLCFGASVYFIWQERNSRIFRKTHRSVDQLYDIIYLHVRLKLMTIKFKSSPNVDRLKLDWQLG